MKEERMVVLGLLEKGIISAEEAERLLMALQSTSSSTREGVGAAVGSALNKAGSALNGMAKTLSEQAGKLEPKVKEVADKVSEKASVIVDDAKTYAEKLKQKREKNKEEDWEDCDMDLQDLQEIWDDDEPEKEIEKEELATEEAPNAYIKNLEGYMNTMQEQMDQINTAENFLKEAFGMEGEEFMDDEEETEEEPEPEKETETEPLKEPEAIQEQLVLEETPVDEDKKED